MAAYEDYRKGLIGTPTRPLGRTDWQTQQAPVRPPSREGVKAARQLGAERGLTGGAQNVFEKLETGQTQAIRGVDPTIVARAQAARTAPTPTPAAPTAPVPVLPTAPSVPTPELSPLFGTTPPKEELGETFDREYFDPLALYTERAANEQLEEIEKYKAEQEALTAEQATARDAALEQRRISAEGKRAAQRNVSGLEQQALLSQIERSKRASFNQLRGQLAKMGAFGTTGSGELDFAVLGEIYEGKSIDVRVEANKGLRDIEIAYFQIRDSIESDQSKSDVEKARSLQQLSERVHTEWQSIQQSKQDSITRLAKEAFGIGAEEEKRLRDQALDLVMRTLNSGQPVSSALLEEAGYKGTQVTVAKEIMGKEANAQNAAQRLDWINSSIRPDFSVDETVVRQAANLLGIMFESLFEDAQKWASAARYEFQSKQKGTGGGGAEKQERTIDGVVYDKPYDYMKGGELRTVYHEKYGHGTLVTDAYGNQLNVPVEATTSGVPGGAIGGALGSLIPGFGGIGRTLGGLFEQPGQPTVSYPPIKVEKIATGLKQNQVTDVPTGLTTFQEMGQKGTKKKTE